MTLTKQLWLAVAAIMTIAFGISFWSASGRQKAIWKINCV